MIQLHETQSIARGNKWSNILSKSTNTREIDWLNSQKNILSDIKAYKTSVDSINSYVYTIDTKDNVTPDNSTSHGNVILTEDALFSLNKSEQVKILNDLGIVKIPRLEKERVNLILDKQGKKQK